jgi:dTDP-4-dehydrorhamnose reductase
VVINCAALTNVDYCETHREESFAINADAVRVIAEETEKKSARLIHISTDYVLSGEQTTPYSETDPARPISVYGESKRAGELAALDVSPDNLAIRISWVFGPHRPSFIDAMLRRAKTEPEISAVDDKYSTPSYTLDLAQMLEPYLADIKAGGILHLCNGGSCSWREYAQHALDAAHAAGLPLMARTVSPIALDSLSAFVAKRPRHTRLSLDRFIRETGQQPRSWQEAVTDYVQTFGEKILA